VHTPIFTVYVGTTKLTAIKLKTRSFNNTFFIHLNKQNAGVLGWPLKLLQSPYSKVGLTSSLPWLLMRHLSFSCRNPARPLPGENTVDISIIIHQLVCDWANLWWAWIVFKLYACVEIRVFFNSYFGFLLLFRLTFLFKATWIFKWLELRVIIIMQPYELMGVKRIMIMPDNF